MQLFPLAVWIVVVAAFMQSVMANIITSFAGTGTAGSGGDGGAATSAQLNQPRGTAISPSGLLYIVDASNHKIRLVSPSQPTSQPTIQPSR